MSYEICVFDPAYAGSREAAHAAWNDETYWGASLPDSDLTAVKWRMKDALMLFDDTLVFKEPEKPRSGLFARFFSKPPAVHRCLYINANDEGAEGASFGVFDHAIEINLPWFAERDEAEKHVRNLWRYLEHFSRSGWTTLYDTERNELLSLEADFDVVLARYLENLKDDDDSNEVDASVAAKPKAPSSATGNTAKDKKPFTGNV
jgi:hypothetical protein